MIIFLVWMWISNIAILLGAELDAELERRRAIAAGHPADEEPFVQLRDDRKLKKTVRVFPRSRPQLLLGRAKVGFNCALKV